MNYKIIFNISAALFLFAGCASSTKWNMQEAVGPVPSGQIESPMVEGILQVFSANEKALSYLVASDYFEKDQIVYELAHTDYEVYSANGERLKKVSNARNRNDPVPAKVSLPAGQYKVVAEAATWDGWTSTYTIPVVIQKGKRTEIHLEADWKPLEELKKKNAVVRGHDGRIVGWMADK